MHVLNILLVSFVQTSSPSASFPSSDRTTEGLEITSNIQLGVSSTPDEEQPEDPRVSSSIPTRSPTTLGNDDATTKGEATTERPEILTVTLLNEPTTEDLMQYSSGKSTERSALEMQTSARTTEDYSTKAKILMKEETSQATGPTSIESYSTTSQNKLRLKATSEAPIERTSIPESTEGPSTKAIERLMVDKTSVTAEVLTSPAAATTESHSTKSVENPMHEVTSEPTKDETSQPQTMEGPSTTAMESMMLVTSSHTTDVKASQPVSTETYSTMSKNKPMLEATSESPIDKTSDTGTTEASSTKIVEGAMLETISGVTNGKTPE